MTTLYFAPNRMWPANSGAQLRNYQLARRLSMRSSVTFVEMRHAQEERCLHPRDSGFKRIVTLDKGRAYTPSRILRGMVGPTPITVLNCWSERSASQLAAVLRSHTFDTVQIEGVHLAKYLPIIQEAPGCREIVVDWHNIESELMWRYAERTRNWLKQTVARRTAKLIERAENDLLSACATHTVTSERERQKLLARRPDANIQVIPNGVDTGFFTKEKIAEACRQAGPCNSKRTILFVGWMAYHANIDAVLWFSRTIWPEISQNYPNLQFTIVGRDPAPAVRALASDRIHVTGTVDDVRPFYASAVATVVPLRCGSGTRLKILESMAAGVPVVSTPLGAEGIEVKDDVHLLLANDVREIAVAVSRVVSSAETRTRLSQAARALVCRVYDWSAIGDRLSDIHANLVESESHESVQSVY